MARYELTEEERDFASRACSNWLAGGGFADHFRRRIVAALKALNTPVPESRGGLTEEQREDITGTLGLDLLDSERFCDAYRDSLTAGLDALNAPAEPCGKCERLKDILRERTSQMADRQTAMQAKCAENDGLAVENVELKEQLATAKAECERVDKRFKDQYERYYDRIAELAAMHRRDRDRLAKAEAEREGELTADELGSVESAFGEWQCDGTQELRERVATGILAKLRKSTQRAEAETEQEKSMQEEQVETPERDPTERETLNMLLDALEPHAIRARVRLLTVAWIYFGGFIVEPHPNVVKAGQPPEPDVH